MGGSGGAVDEAGRGLEPWRLDAGTVEAVAVTWNKAGAEGEHTSSARAGARRRSATELHSRAIIEALPGHRDR